MLWRQSARLILAASIPLAGLWLVATKSLPYALAANFPDLALTLNPDNPSALIVKAEGLRAELFATIARAKQAAAKGDSSQAEVDFEAKRRAIKAQIADLARRTIASAPLNATAYRLLAEVSDDTDTVRTLMEEAVKRSRREYVALLWLLNDAYHRKNYESAVRNADLLLRTRGETSPYVLGYLVLISEEGAGEAPLLRGLSEKPGWRQAFFQALALQAKQVDTPLKIAIGLKERGAPVSAEEISPYFNALIQKNLADVAYNAWLQIVGEAQPEKTPWLNNGDFDRTPSGLPFDWTIARGVNAVAERTTVGNSGQEHALHVAFSGGRAQFPEVRQMILLPPGQYRLEGRLRGKIEGTRGLRWQIQCASQPHRPLAETEMLFGGSQDWRDFTVDVTVPELGICRGQVLRLYHDARSPSEEIAAGEVWFGGLRLSRLEPIQSSTSQ